MVTTKIVLFLLVIFNHHANGQIAMDKFSVFTNVWYKCYSNSSYLNEIIVQKRLQCAQKSNCQTATFDQANHRCLLYSELIGLGEQVARKDAFIFTRKDNDDGTHSIPSPTTLMTTTSTSRSLSTISFNPCAAAIVIPSATDSWICANVRVTITGGSDRTFYVEEGAKVTANNTGGTNTLFLKRGVVFTRINGNFDGYYTGSSSVNGSGIGYVSMRSCSSLTFDYTNVLTTSCINTSH